MTVPNQFVVYRVVPSTTRPGKTDKMPIAPSGRAYIDAYAPAHWMSREDATAAAARLGANHGIGFVFTEADDYWFLDLDECRVGDAWTDAAVALCHRLPGAYVEVSVSGRGLHIIGRGRIPPHGTKHKDLGDGIALFSKLRFCALTGTSAMGDMEADLTTAICAIAAESFPPGSPQTQADWTDVPCEGYGGPADDDDLIRMACASQSAAAAVGGRASFKQLWDADEAALSKYFPDDHKARPYDASAADAALAQHLAFWTGKDCARIQRLMERSTLRRDKWENRDDYLPRTITVACGKQRSVATGARRIEVVAASAVEIVTEDHILASDLDRHFEGAVYIEDRYAAAVPDGSILSPQQFRSRGRYGGKALVYTGDGKTTRNAWEAFVENTNFVAPFAHTLCFRPSLPSRSLVSHDGRILFNAYVPIETRSVAGDASPFLGHLAKLLPNDRDRQALLSWMAFVVQNPGKKALWAPLLQGCEGNGKTFLSRVMAFAVGERYSHIPNAQDLANKFNGWLDQKLFIGIEEIHVSDRRDILDTIKPWITNLRGEIQNKGQNQVTGDIPANFLLNSNHKDAIPKTKGDRRYAPFFCAQQEASDLARDGMDGMYFPKLMKWAEADGFAICNHYLRSFVIADEFNPAVLAHRAPDTSSTAEAIEAGLGPVEQAVREAIEMGEVGFRRGWVSSHWLGLLLDARRLRTKANPNQWDGIMKALGYERHPTLFKGRPNNPVSPENKRSRLWVRSGSIQANSLTTPAEIARAYAAAQEATDNTHEEQAA